MIRRLLSFCMIAALALAQAVTPETSQGRPDLSGCEWTTVNSPHLKSKRPGRRTASRDGSLVNFERDGALIRRADLTSLSATVWKSSATDQNGNEADPLHGCMLGRSRMGPPDKIVRTSGVIFLYVCPPRTRLGRSVPSSRGWPRARRRRPGRNWEGESIPLGGDTLVTDTIGFNGSVGSIPRLFSQRESACGSNGCAAGATRSPGKPRWKIPTC
jgi:hypothetical protein